MPEVSVLLPTFNNGPFIEDAVNSILNQSYTDFELIIIDDASTDETRLVLKNISDKRIVLIHNENNLGLIKSLNIGLNCARGRFISRMDGDDLCHVDKLKFQVSFLKNNESIGVCGTWVKTFGKVNHLFNHPLTSEEIKAEFLFNSSLVHATMLIRRELFLLINNSYPNVEHAEDFCLFNIMKDFTSFANIPKYLYFYRVHNDSVSFKYSEVQIKSTKVVYKKLLKSLNISATDLELDLHFDIAKGNVKFYSRRNFLAIYWLINLKIKNNRFKIYDNKHFNKVLLFYFFKLFKF